MLGTRVGGGHIAREVYPCGQIGRLDEGRAIQRVSCVPEVAPFLGAQEIGKERSEQPGTGYRWWRSLTTKMSLPPECTWPSGFPWAIFGSHSSQVVRQRAISAIDGARRLRVLLYIIRTITASRKTFSSQCERTTGQIERVAYAVAPAARPHTRVPQSSGSGFPKCHAV